MNEIKWRFPSSGHAIRKGISSGDTETFKKQPYEAFAREILQNSLDASNNEKEPVIVKFKKIQINSNLVPGINDLKIAIKRCKAFWKDKKDYISYLDNIEKELNNDIITCLKISDYNTTGLIGVESNEINNNNFIALTKGSGLSIKSNDLSGGSKGLGKNAAFLLSKINTVFYNTRTSKDINQNPNNYSGYIGVANFISGYLDDNYDSNSDYTQGVGYYCSNDCNAPINDLIDFEENCDDRKTSSGTDIFILGFEDEQNWEKDVINSILDSFMASIFNDKLQIQINDLHIKSDNLNEIINSTIIKEKNKSNIISQYKILNGDGDVSMHNIDTDYGPFELYILKFDKENSNLATNKCAMIRYPLMKIKDINLSGVYKASAMCIIPDNNLGRTLLKIENPEHRDWEYKRGEGPLKKEYKNLLDFIKNSIIEKVSEILQDDSDEPIDPNGAGDYLPDIDVGKSNNVNNEKVIGDNTKVTKKKIVKVKETNANQKSDSGYGLEPVIGSVDENDETGDVSYPSGHNDKKGSDPHPGDETGGLKDGDNVVLKRSYLTGINYKFISIDKKACRYRIVFSSPIKNEKSYLKLSLLDDMNKKTDIKILNMLCNGKEIMSKDNITYGPFVLMENTRMILDIIVDKKGYFGCEVKVICE